jgi:hypothetical protein
LHSIPAFDGSSWSILNPCATRPLAATIVATQLMRTIDTNGSLPKPEDIEAYLKESGSLQFCKSQDLPLADWRDFRETDVRNTTPTSGEGPMTTSRITSAEATSPETRPRRAAIDREVAARP